MKNRTETGQISVLLIEDDEESCRAMEGYFAELEDIAIVHTTNSSSKALKYMRENPPNAVILDLELHNGSGSGIAFLNGLRTFPSSQRPYVLVTTNNSSQITYRAVRRLGADFILYKHQTDYSPQSVADILLSVCAAEPPAWPTETDEYCSAQNGADLRKIICTALDSVNISPRLRGYEYLADAIEMYVHGRVNNVSAAIGEKYGKSKDSVERAMQNAINKAWNTTDIDTLRQNYTAHVNPKKGVPTILEFVCYYANQIKNESQ